MPTNIEIVLNQDPCEFITLPKCPNVEMLNGMNFGAEAVEVHIPTVLISDNTELKLRMLEQLAEERNFEVAEAVEITDKVKEELVRANKTIGNNTEVLLKMGEDLKSAQLRAGSNRQRNGGCMHHENGELMSRISSSPAIEVKSGIPWAWVIGTAVIVAGLGTHFKWFV
ncbi:hypothetical protein COPG_00113 [Colwellia phage 9A]|uniref:Uncharacterized protein n=1 Tax=Colwellia phage 9A TaxID=765765 RepID=I3UMJ4_9CAUD|nr:hypothetical protein COPG_00113 [Colwellia phage 9A]AFK66709.1 hypothetical protein COPG_00113 [Colwellia phage 9A]